MFGPLCGGPDDIPGIPASRPSRPGSPRWRRRRCSAPAGRGFVLGQRTGRHLPGQGHRSELPTAQRLGQTSLLKLGVRNTGKRDRAGADRDASRSPASRGATPRCPFGVRDPQPELAQPDRPVWVLAADLPAAARLLEAGRRPTSSPKTFAFGPLKPGATTTAVWKLSAVRAGKYTLLYEHRRRAQRQGEGGDRQRRPGPAARSRPKSANACRKPKSPTAAKSLKSRKASRASTRVRRRWRCSLALALPACGSASDTSPHARGTGRSGSSAKRGVALKKIGSFDAPVFVTGARASRSSSSSSSKPGRSSSCATGSRRRKPFLDLRGAGLLRRRAGTALGRLPARLRAQQALLRLLHRQRRQHPHRRIQARERDPRRAGLAAPGDRRSPTRSTPTTTAASCSSSATSSTSAPATAAPAATRRTTPRTRTCCSASCCGSTRAPPAASPTRCRATTRSSAARPRRDLQLRAAQPLPLLLRHGTVRAAANRDRRRRPEPLRGARLHDRRRGRRRQLRLGRLRGLRPLHGRKQRHPGSRRHRQADLRLQPRPPRRQLPIIGGYVVRDPRLPSLRGRYVYADLCEGQLRSARPAPEPGERRPRARPPRRKPELLRRRRPAPPLRRLARRPRLPSRLTLDAQNLRSARNTYEVFCLHLTRWQSWQEKRGRTSASTTSRSTWTRASAKSS